MLEKAKFNQHSTLDNANNMCYITSRTKITLIINSSKSKLTCCNYMEGAMTYVDA